ncbi:hypothetical protein AGMMS49975_29300 [Clostridia bacterium]|nr:hypothetical protein AGMMS49975_29300 [Clostridia bacterium]
MKLTKENMLAVSGQCVGILVSFLDIRQNHNELNAAFNILAGRDMDFLNLIRNIEMLYIAAEDCHFCGEDAYRFDSLLELLPNTVWVE